MVQASKQAQTISTAKAGLMELRVQQQPSSPSARKAEAEVAPAAKVLSPMQQQQHAAAAPAPAAVAAPRPVQLDEPKFGENVTPNVVNEADSAEKNAPAVQLQQHITLRRSSRAKRSSPATSSSEPGGSGGSESDSHTPRTSDAGIGKTDIPASVHVQGHSGSANAVAWMSASDFISVGADGVARVWDASGAKLSAKGSFQGEWRARAPGA